MDVKQALIIFTKEPIVGKVKTRLARTIGDKEATKIYKLMLENLLKIELKKDIDIFISLQTFTNSYKEFFPNENIFFQGGNDIGEKMANSFKNIFSKGYESIILVGADIPFFDNEFFEDCFERLQNYEAVISKTYDEGYCLIGFQKDTFEENIFSIDYSKNVFSQTIKKLQYKKVYETKTFFDIDDINDLRKFCEIENLKTNLELQDYSKKLLKNLPKISIIIPVYYEKDNLPKTIKMIEENSFYKDYEIIVCDTHDKTTINDIDCSNFKVALSKPGRSFQLNEGEKSALGEILLFLHADTILPKNWDKYILDLYEKDKDLAGAFKLGIQTQNPIIKAIEFLANIRVIFTNTPYGDQGQFFSSKLFYNISGYDEIPLMEDIEIIKKVHKKNLKVKIINEKIYTSDRRWQKEGVFYTSIRNRILSTLYFFGVSSENLKKYYKF